MIALFIGYVFAGLSFFMIIIAALAENFTELGLFWNVVIGTILNIILIYLIVGITKEHIRDHRSGRYDV